MWAERSRTRSPQRRKQTRTRRQARPKTKGMNYMAIKNDFDIKKKLVLEGNSRIFNDWAAHSTITAEEFLENLEWVCDDPMQKIRLMTAYGVIKDRVSCSSTITAETFAEFLEDLEWACDAPMHKVTLMDSYAALKDQIARSSTITAEAFAEFLEDLERVCKLEDSYTVERMTREIGLTPTGIVRLQRVNDAHGNFVGFYLQDGKIWEGAIFEIPCPEAEKSFYGDTIEERHKISISCRDRI